MSDFRRIADELLYALKSLGDLRLTPFCAEYLVAATLQERGHEVKMSKKQRGVDIQLEDIGKKIEVKSSHMDLEDWDCCASFGNGKKVMNKEFDYCVFVVFEKLEPKEFLVLTPEEVERYHSEEGTFKNNKYLLCRDDIPKTKLNDMTWSKIK